MERKFGNLLFFSSLLFLGISALLISKEMVAFGTFLVGLSYALRDYFDRQSASLSAMSVYALFAGLWFGLGNLAGYLAEEGIYHELFFKYEVMEFAFDSQLLAALGAVIPLLVYDWAKSIFRHRQRVSLLPKVGVESPDSLIFIMAIVLVLIGWTFRYLGSLFSLGTVDSFILMGPNIAIFVLTMRWLDSEPPQMPTWSRWVPIGVMSFDVVTFTMFSNMRNNIVWPIASLCLPYLLHKAITAKRFAFGLVLIFGFIFVFKPLGELRGQIFGAERLTQIVERSPFAENQNVSDDDFDRWGAMTALARLSTFNQLTQISRIVHEEGYYEGETLDYLLYVFIPRIIWRDKPQIVPGQWFAEKIGRGFRMDDTRFSNAINMTIPGELFLNFGWFGVVLGMALLGFLYFLFWQSASIYSEKRNLLGQAFAVTLFTQAIFSGSHFGGVVNLVLWYLMLLAFTFIIRIFLKPLMRMRQSSPTRTIGPAPLTR